MILRFQLDITEIRILRFQLDIIQMSYVRQLALIVPLNGTELLHDLRRSFEFVDIGKVSLK